jgi:hypothetical protein
VVAAVLQFGRYLMQLRRHPLPLGLPSQEASRVLTTTPLRSTSLPPASSAAE